MQGNYKPVTPTKVTVDLGDCPDGSLINFTNTLPGCIEGFKLNETGHGLEGWTIEVRDSTGAVVASNISIATGHWQVCGLENGTYTVCEVQQPGWIQIDPPNCYDITMAGQNISDLNFTNMQSLCLSGHKFTNRTKEGLGGWTIVVSNATRQLAGKIITDDTGFWQKSATSPQVNTRSARSSSPAGSSLRLKAATMHLWSTRASPTWTSTTTVRAAT